MTAIITSSSLAALEAARLGFNPQEQPTVAIPTLPRIAPEILRPDWIQRALAQSVTTGVDPLFSQFVVPDFAHYPEGVQAAVCIPLVHRDNGLHVLLTRRAGHLLKHAGQVCFPGGRIEPDDKSPIEAALRETHEEVGILPSFIQTLGEQPIFITGTRYAMRPVVGLVKDGFTIQADPSEVAEVFEVPLAVLMDPQYHLLHAVPNPTGKMRYYFSMSWNNHFIWGATAAVIRNFYHHLAAVAPQVQR